MPVKLHIQENVPLAPLTTLKIGGKARFFVHAHNKTDVREAFKFAKNNDFDLFILGGGSNVLISDKGFDGLVLQIALKGISVIGNEEDEVQLKVGAGEDWDNFVEFCVEKNFAGIECLSGIPGFVGGTPIQNVGAYGQEVSETINNVEVFDRKIGEILEFTNDDCDFSYRKSIFNTTEKNRFIVLSVTFSLKKNGAPKIEYKDLQNFFNDKKPNLTEARKAVLNIRALKSMVINENDPNSRSVGSFFKNPVVSNEKFDEIFDSALEKGVIEKSDEIPYFKTDDQNKKIPAAWLIEKSGFSKGYRDGSVGLSENHTLAIINRGAANAEDILKFKELIQKEVKKKFDIFLHPEPIFIGFK